jgi:hypothetical protein
MLIPVLAVIMSSCIGVPAVHTLAYAPQPLRISDPPAELRSLILGNTVQSCVTQPEFAGPQLVVSFVCNSGAGNTVLRFDRIQGVELQQQGPWYRVRVHHSAAEDFVWDFLNRQDAERALDAIVAISEPRTEVQSTPTRI